MAYGPVNVGGAAGPGAGYGGLLETIEAANTTANAAFTKAESAEAAARSAKSSADSALSKAESLAEVLEQGGGTGGEITLSYYHIGAAEPENTKLLWIDTTEGIGGLKYHDGSAWVAVPVVWG